MTGFITISALAMSPATLETILRAELLDMPDAERVALLARLFRGICRDCGSQRLPCGCATDDAKR